MKIHFDLEKIKRYDQSGPRYTSYPTAVAFTDRFSESDYQRHARDSNQDARPLSLYFHIPFCDTVCFFCACNKIATKDYSKTDTYLHYLYQEMDRQASLFDNNRVVEQLHWGGGTPTFLNHQQIRALMAYTRKTFTVFDDDSGDYSIEIDPRSVSAETIKVLRAVGFNRFSLGVQDIDPKVQKAVNRIQPIAETEAIIDACREQKAKSISIDLIYGLPLQTASGFMKTLEAIIRIAPDRISLFNYAHLPHLFKPQRRIHEEQLPPAAEKLTILQNSIAALTKAGYHYIGMDHFAKPDDELSIAQQQGKLHRNFQGYTTHAGCDLIAMGVSAISSVNTSYSQNEKTLAGYYAAIDEKRLPLIKGISLSKDDRLRRDIIQQISCHFRCDFAAIAEKYEVDYKTYFADELCQLEALENDALLTVEDGMLIVQASGRLLVRTICMVFDCQLKQAKKKQQFSKVI